LSHSQGGMEQEQLSWLEKSFFATVAAGEGNILLSFHDLSSIQVCKFKNFDLPAAETSVEI
jgi:hypothetical protein